MASPVVLRGHESGVLAVAISPNNRWVVTGSYDKTARLWDLRAKDPAASPVILRGHAGGVTAVAISEERMAENLNIFDFELNAEDNKAIATLDQKTSSFFDHRDPEKVKWLGTRKLEH